MIHTGEWWVFLGLMPVVYWLLPAGWRMGAIAMASIALLSIFVFGDLLVMIALATAIFAAFRLKADGPLRGLARAAQSPWPLIVILAYFIWSKYLPAMAAALGAQASIFDLAIPLGVSYFSFKLLHYSIEMRRGNFPEHGPADFAGWLFLAPIFTAGPIERFDHFLSAREIQAFRVDFLAEGGVRIAQGLVKKFLIGVLLLEAIEQVTGGSVVSLLGTLEAASPATIWAVLFLTLAYVYIDFSAYSDIAIGSSRLFGLRIMENFNLPFLAGNLQSFWQRWHMTLAHWCRSYIYMSMIGLTRNPYAALLATFLVMGLWHAASPHWIAWGLWHGTGMAAVLAWSRYATKRKITAFKSGLGRLAAWAITLSYVALGGAFTMLHGREPLYQSVRLIAKAFAVDLR